MKRILAALVVLVMAQAQARIGETETQCRRRYGREQYTGVGFHVYRLGEYTVAVHYHEGVCDAIIYMRTDNGQIGDKEAMALLDANRGDGQWVEDLHAKTDTRRTWRRKDHEAWHSMGTGNHYLAIQHDQFPQRSTAEELAKVREGMGGF